MKNPLLGVVMMPGPNRFSSHYPVPGDTFSFEH
ncbi:hypothetical protein N826_02140 [Skermanella aerolata KACC 11604]|nr:hypothetical protein N826_02140 [Skermanella aerolata KACC 11604]